MKEYQANSLITDTDGSVFVEKLSARINDYQTLGLIVEIQYSSSASYFTALVLGYNEVTN